MGRIQPEEVIWPEGPQLSELHNNVYQAMSKIAQHVNILQRDNDELQKDNSTLRWKIKGLEQEIATLRPTKDHPAVGAVIGDDANVGQGLFKPGVKLVEHQRQIHDVAVNHTGDIMATASWDTQLKLYDFSQEKVVRTIPKIADKEAGGMGGSIVRPSHIPSLMSLGALQKITTCTYGSTHRRMLSNLFWC